MEFLFSNITYYPRVSSVFVLESIQIQMMLPASRDQYLQASYIFLLLRVVVTVVEGANVGPSLVQL